MRNVWVTVPMFELVVALEATYDNPYDVRDVELFAVFTGPDGREWPVPGFWDADDAWWPAGYAVTDVPQMHSYDSQHDPVYTVRPFDTWQGIYLDESQATADRSGRMTVILPPFTRDVAVRLNH